MSTGAKFCVCYSVLRSVEGLRIAAGHRQLMKLGCQEAAGRALESV